MSIPERLLQGTVGGFYVQEQEPSGSGVFKMLSRMRGVPNGSVPGAQEGPILSSRGSPGTYTFNITEASPLSGILEREADCSWGPAAVPVTVLQMGELSVGAHFLSSPAEPPNSHRPWGPRARTALGGCETDGPLH